MIGLMDCNNFFVSCERLFRPDLLGKPVAVLSSNDGCIVARSQEVKDLGIPMGIPYFEVRDVCTKERVTLFSSNFALYRDVSARVMSALKEEFPACEVYSVDEAFFEIEKGVSEEEIAEIRARIIQKTGIPVSIGVAKTKTLAKVANSIAKKRKGGSPEQNVQGVCVMSDDLWQRTRATLPCGSIWGIGRQTSAFLSQHNINTVEELCMQDSSFITQSLGVVGERLMLELQGVPVYSLGDSGAQTQESYMSTRSFSKPIYDKLTLKSALGHHATHLGEKLRSDGCVASKVTIIARGSRFGPFAHREGSLGSVFVTPTDDTFVLIKEVEALLDTLYDSEIPYKKAGVVLSGIEPKAYITSSLFNLNGETKTTRLNAVSDEINHRFGKGSVRSASTLGEERWQEHKKRKSPEYTTKWSEIACIKAI